MAEMLLINPRKRRAKKASAKRRVRRNPVTVLKSAAPAKRRRRNPVGMSRVAAVATRRRRRNPIGGFNVNGIVRTVQDAAVGAAGAVAIDLIMGQVQPMLPAVLMRVPGSPSMGDAFKMAVTIVAGELLKKPTKGLSTQMALGALTVQAHEVLSSFIPSSMPVGYGSPARITQGSNRLVSNMTQVGAYTPAGQTALLSAYTKPNTATPMLNGMKTARAREGYPVR